MSDTTDALILDLLEWMGPGPRRYAEVLEAWRTSCPRLPVWDGANDRGFVARHRVHGRGVLVSVSAAGAERLRKHRDRLRRADGWPRWGTHLLPPHEEGAQVGSITFEMNEEQARRSKLLLLAESRSAGASSRRALAQGRRRGAVSALSAGGLLAAALRTGRASLPASGSP